MNSKMITYLTWVARILAAVIMIQTLYFKFTGAEESIYIFTTVGMEPWGRIGVGVMELIASLLIIFPATSWIGAGIAFGLMVGAMGMHLTILGIEVQSDGGYLFFLALIVAVCSAFVLWMSKELVLGFISKVLGKKST
jgi:putative oxidoreductase